MNGRDVLCWFFLFRKRKHGGVDGAKRGLKGAKPQQGFAPRGLGISPQRAAHDNSNSTSLDCHVPCSLD